MSNEDKQLAEHAKRLFDESVDGIDAASLSRLNRGRQAALEAAAGARTQWRWWVPATGAATAAALALILLPGPGIDVPDAPASDLEILLSEENIDLFEDLEFYSWLEAAELDDHADIG